MLLIGLTGAIATGKSTVSSYLAQPPNSLPIIDADLLARKVVEPGTAGYKKIVEYFGPTTPDLLLPSATETEDPVSADSQGRPLNRPALGRRIFGNSEERKRVRAVLNGIVHPAVRREMYKALFYYYIRGHWAVVLDVPLLFESGLDKICGTVLVVAVSEPEMQMQRLRARDPHLSPEDAQNRVLSQSDVRQRAKRAIARGPGRGAAVWNDGDKDDLKKQVDDVVADIRAKSPDWWSVLLWIAPPIAVMAAAYQFARSWLDAKRWMDAEREEKATA
ncbi:putative dephosphokinase [Phaeomoniella chlamydospora]|uniref:Putative dephosphokinase n=1 Tax=Phaeomoniella chlamydospora TaxID=158046 RepID=A0A0G2F2A6_PHACM|nr:putative dephosphokinase [Phaeomoniella chlamydospora]